MDNLNIDTLKLDRLDDSLKHVCWSNIFYCCLHRQLCYDQCRFVRIQNFRGVLWIPCKFTWIYKIDLFMYFKYSSMYSNYFLFKFNPDQWISRNKRKLHLHGHERKLMSRRHKSKWRHGCHADNRWTLYNLLIVPLLPIVRYDFDNLLEYDTGSLLDKSKITNCLGRTM